MQKAEQKHTYKQLETEPDKHYSVFYNYLTMGEHRRIKNLDGHFYNLHEIYYLSKKYHWKERILNYESTIGEQIRKEKRQKYISTLSEYEENALLTFGTMQSRYREFIGNISDFWPNEVEDKKLKQFIQKMNKDKKDMGNFKNITPLYKDHTSDKNNVSRQLNHIEKVLNIIAKFQIISDKFIIKLEKGDFQKKTKLGEIFLEDLEDLSEWILETNEELSQRANKKIEQESKIKNNKKLANIVS